MYRKLFFALSCALALTTTAGAATYPTKPLANPVPKAQTTQYYYNCNWSYYPAVQYVIHKLREYQVKSIIYPYQLRLIIPDYVLYQPLTNYLINTAKPPMSLILALMHYLPGAKVTIVGYSDNIATPTINQRHTLLSAQKIAGIFWNHGYPAVSQMVSYQGAGASDPIADNARVDGMAANRRIEIVMSFPHRSFKQTYYK